MKAKRKDIRFEAEWCHSQKRDKDGEWNPDMDENRVSYHKTKDEAEKAAIKASKAAPASTEWIRVAEAIYDISDCGLLEWITIRSWTGDWEGLSADSVYEFIC